MTLSVRLLAASALALALVAAPAVAQDAQTIERAEAIRDRALAGNIALDYVTQLPTRFGPRPAGSRSEQEAAAFRDLAGRLPLVVVCFAALALFGLRGIFLAVLRVLCLLRYHVLRDAQHHAPGRAGHLPLRDDRAAEDLAATTLRT